ncbi:hypothetical protein Ddye_017799 [Dipteronia dyeriana]|uniref:Receptor-like serine/threonine-protein kinase n=1 Tax=Dipteronia dyeriana TaxID=168575 RepID=A0AAD9X1Q4_9ROSI|nr:hypothetical protein Ddye_017799 [Dipteronia dyeriana]
MATFAALSSLLFLCLSQLPYYSSAVNIILGSSLSSATDNKSSWLSPSGEFAFGFRQLNNSDLFLLAIWFNKIPEKTIVWYVNGDIPAPRGSTLKLTTNGLVLNNPGGQMVWNTSASPASPSVTEAAMLDTGNFVLTGSGSDFVWESFRNPTDTILPTQTLDLGSMLFSKLTATNFSKGRFELHFDKGIVQLNPVAWPSRSIYNSYYSSGTSSINSSESGNKLVFNATGNIYIVKTNGEIAQLSPWDTVAPRADRYYRATLDSDGVFTQYAYQNNSPTGQSWWALRILPENMCTATFNEIGSGTCGFNSYCSIQNGRPSCDCPPEYEFVDQSNRFMGCRPNFRQGCGGDDGSRDYGELYEIREFNNVNWPLGDYESLAPYSQKDCELSCIYDCSCAVAIYDGVTRCWKKKLPLSNGRNERTGFSKVLFKVRKGDSSSGFGDNSGSRRRGPILLGALLLGGSVFFNVILLVAMSLAVFVWHKREAGNNAQDSSVSVRNMRCFTYKELEEATDGFKEELGRGSFGIVYKGDLRPGSRNAIAVKKLDKLVQEREREFETELSAIGRTHHKNLVQLLGFCHEGVHRVLVYEFMGNGNLANFLFAIPKPDWNLRVRIALEIAKGLVYLHEECNIPIIHCDIKPQNILLDQHFIAKISDFGLSKLLLSNQSRTLTMVRGTRGYVAPEWFKTVPVTAKVDVYSFGVMLLEIICCRRSVEMECEEENRAILTDWACECYVERRLDVLVDDDKAAMADKARLHKWLMIAIWCIQEDPSKRPTMKLVMQMLEGFSEVPQPPSFPSSSFSVSVEY